MNSGDGHGRANRIPTDDLSVRGRRSPLRPMVRGSELSRSGFFPTPFTRAFLPTHLKSSRDAAGDPAFTASSRTSNTSLLLVYAFASLKAIDRARNSSR
jgi:hypothetical protein